MDAILAVIAALSVAAWGVLLFARGGFWRACERLDAEGAEPAEWPAIVAIVPARNEAEVIARSIRSVVTQDYPGALAAVLVDDHSEDGTAAVAGAVAEDAARRLTIVQAGAPPHGWAGKLWALSEGLRHAAVAAPEARFVWFTDADIAHDARSQIGRAHV